MLLLLGPGARHHFQRLPYFGPVEINGTDTTYYTLPDWKLTDEEGQEFILHSLKGKFWLAAFFSVSDTNIVKITKRLLYFTDRYIDEPDIQVICFNIDPNGNDVNSLREYIDKMPTYDGSLKKIRFLTATPERMDSLLQSFQVADIKREEIFRLVDADGHIRGKYGNTEYHIGDAISDAGMIKKEYDRKKADESSK